MTQPLKGVGASVRAKLLQLARQRGDDFQLVLLRYVNERLLYRLATSSHANRFVLKGAVLFTVWTGKPHRATRDLDLLGYGESSEGNLRDVFNDVVTMKTENDGVVFDASSLKVGAIRENQEYGGLRVTLTRTLRKRRSGCRSTWASAMPSLPMPSKSISRRFSPSRHRTSAPTRGRR